jgi:hypothetical protein
LLQHPSQPYVDKHPIFQRFAKFNTNSAGSPLAQVVLTLYQHARLIITDKNEMKNRLLQNSHIGFSHYIICLCLFAASHSWFLSVWSLFFRSVCKLQVSKRDRTDSNRERTPVRFIDLNRFRLSNSPFTCLDM